MGLYQYSSSTIKSYIQSIYSDGLQRSSYLSDIDIEDIVANIGLFKFKGYVRAYKNRISAHSIDEVFILYFFDKYLTRIVMDLTSSIETKLKTILVELCYKQIKSLPSAHIQKNNPFFYLIQSNYKLKQDNTPFSLNYGSVQTWKAVEIQASQSESYLHYGLYYKNNYNFIANRQQYLSTSTLMKIYNGINYPPFHYFIESATLGTVIELIKHLKIGSYDVLQKLATKFGITNRNIDFTPYLERLKELRNRAAHRERIFNRSYRSITRVSHFHAISQEMNDHKFIDVYMYLYFMMDKLDNHDTSEKFIQDEVKILFESFKKDHWLKQDSKMLTEQIDRDKYQKYEQFILEKMR